MRISVVIPVHEDREALRERMSSLGTAWEVIVVDASRADPVLPCDLPERAQLVVSDRALRSHQQNLGARRATGEVLVFLHADTALGPGALAQVEAALEDPAVVGGGFERTFDGDSVFLDWTCRLAAWRGRRFGWFLGDQVIFARRAVFEAVGGFREVRLFEDYDLCRRLKATGRLVCLQPPVCSSARRFAAEGPVVRSLKDLALTGRYLARGWRAFASDSEDREKEDLQEPAPW